MIAISIANKDEWKSTLEFFKIEESNISNFPYGQYFNIRLKNKELLFYNCGVRKTLSSGACQYIIDNFEIDKIIVVGTCAGVDKTFKPLDIVIPNKLVQYDCTVREVEPLIKERFNVEINLSKLNFEYKTGTLGTADKPLVMWEDYQILSKNNIHIVDTESASIALICKINNIECIVIKGISDFPIKEISTDTQNTYTNQYNTFLLNIPKIMTHIYDNYLLNFI